MSHSELVSEAPATGEALWRGVEADAAAIDAAVAAARGAFPAWARRPLEERRALVRAFAAALAARKEPLAALLAAETGKPLWEARTEVDSAIGKVEISVRAQDERAGERSTEAPGGARLALRHRPHGVLAVLGPFNFPLHLPNGHMVPALLAGNAVVFKPSEKTPAIAEATLEAWRAAGLPEGLVQIVHGGGGVGRALVLHRGVDGVLFTGSVAAGRAIHAGLADAPHKILALEMGGNAPLLVWEPDSLEDAAHIMAQSAWVSAGQRCSCARRLILPAGADGDAALDAVVALARRLLVGAPFDDPAPFMGPVIDNAAADALLAAQVRLEAAGGRALLRMERMRSDRPFLTPGLIDVTDVHPRPDEEWFGPLLQVIRADDFEAALTAAADTRFGLSAAFVGRDEARYRRFWEAAPAGAVNWNRPTTGAPSSLPFGGIGHSGNHRPSAYYAADYCAYPVAGVEAPNAAFRIAAGLRP